jgi:hypothetical protein
MTASKHFGDLDRRLRRLEQERAVSVNKRVMAIDSPENRKRYSSPNAAVFWISQDDADL